jgi:protein-disulfide isomerase
MQQEVWKATAEWNAPRILGGVVLGLALFAGGCARDGNATPNAAAPAAAPAAVTSSTEPEVLATVGDEQVTLTDVRAKIGDQLDMLEARYLRQRYKAIQTTMTTLLRDRMLEIEAKRQGKTVDEIVAAEAGGSLDPSSAEARQWYDENRNRTQGRSFEQLESQIVELLRNERRATAASKLEQRLNKDLKVVVNYQPLRVELNNEGAPALGPSDAPVTVVEFSDFQCPYCKSFAPTLKRLEQNFGKQVRLVYRQYPIPSLHPAAVKAAEASLCANEQGKFWEMHDLMFAEQNNLLVSDLKEKAARLKMNKSKFDTCMDNGRYVEQVQNDMKEGGRVGVAGTPALFINGVPVEGGAVSYDVMVKLIEQELERVKK